MTQQLKSGSARVGRATEQDASCGVCESPVRLAELLENEERLRLATEAAGIGLWDNNLARGVLIWQPRVKAMFGMSPESTITREEFYAAIHPDDLEMAKSAFAAACDPARRALYDVEYRVIGREDGILRWVSAKGKGVFNEAGECLRVIGVAVDITRRKATEQRLRELNEKLVGRVEKAVAERQVLAEVVESTDALIQVVDRDLRLLAINKASIALFADALSHEPKVGDAVVGLTRPWPKLQSRQEACWRRALAGEKFTVIESIGQRQYEMKFYPLQDGASRVIGAYQFAYDVTERLQDEAKLADAERRLRQSQKIEALGQLTGGVAHDFNNLLMVISGGIALLERVSDPVKRAQALEGMRRAVEKGAGLTRHLLAFSSSQALRPKPIQLKAKLVELQGMLSRSLGTAVVLSCEVPDGLWAVHIDPNEFELALLNLCLNSRDAQPRGGKIRLCARNRPALQRPELSGDFVEVEVTDDGVGMTPEVAHRACEPFFTTKETGKGSGLGLAQVFGFAKQSGGMAEIESTLGRGTTVRLLLPRSFAAVDDQPVAAADVARPAEKNFLAAHAWNDHVAATVEARGRAPERRPRGSARRRGA